MDEKEEETENSIQQKHNNCVKNFSEKQQVYTQHKCPINVMFAVLLCGHSPWFWSFFVSENSMLPSLLLPGLMGD